MLSQRKAKSHRMKWVEAERELAIRGVFPLPYQVKPEYFLTSKEVFLPQVKDDLEINENENLA